MSLESGVEDAFNIRDYIMDNVFDDNRPFDIVDTAIISLFNSIASKAEAISILNKNKKFSEIGLILRPFLEQYLYLEFILEKNTNKRAQAYFYNQRYGSLKKYKSYIKNAKDEKTKKEIEEKFNNTFYAKSLSGRKTIEEDFEYFKEKYINTFPDPSKSKQRKNWFNVELNGIYKFTDLVEYLGEEDLYWGLYNLMTYDTHGLSAPSDICIEKKNDQTFVNVGSIDSKSTHVLVQSLLNKIILNVLKYYGLLNNKKFQGIILKIKINANSWVNGK